MKKFKLLIVPLNALWTGYLKNFIIKNIIIEYPSLFKILIPKIKLYSINFSLISCTANMLKNMPLIYPFGKTMSCWKLILAFTLLFAIWKITYQLFFSFLEGDDIYDFSFNAVLLFDILLKFNSGFYHEGKNKI